MGEDVRQGLTLVVGLLLVSAEHDIGASNWCWLVNLTGLGMIGLVALKEHQDG